MCSSITYAERLLFSQQYQELLEIVKDPHWYNHDA